MKYLILFLLILAFCSFSQTNKGSNNIGWWVYYFGDYPQTDGKTDPRAEWTKEVFERVKSVADRVDARDPQLVIIKDKRVGYALALPDGGIIINPSTLSDCYDGSGRTLGDSRMAFILGHELAHLSNRDYTQQEAFAAMESLGDKTIDKILKQELNVRGDEKSRSEDSKKKEIMADAQGAVYAAMSGFDLNLLIGDQGENKKENFLQQWAGKSLGQSRSGDPRHPSMQSRAQLIRAQLAAVARQVELFKAGVLLFQVGSFHDAAAAFIEFSKPYPSREVFNNIGACYLHLTLDLLHLKYTDDYYRFRLSSSIDYSTTSERIHPRGSDNYLKDKDILFYITKAEEYFKLAVSRDPSGSSSRYNLAAASILKKEYAQAMWACDEILKHSPQDVDALNNKAVAFYYYGKKEDLDFTQKAIKTLEDALRLKPSSYETLYNLAALKNSLNRVSGAKKYWEKYLDLATAPRDNFYAYVYKHLYGKNYSKPINNVPAPQVPSGIKLGDDLAGIKKKWGKTHLKIYKLGNMESNTGNSWAIDLQVLVKDHIRVIALDGFVEIVEKESVSPGDVKSITSKLGPPTKMVRHGMGSFWVYKEKGFSIKVVNGKAVSYTWFAGNSSK